MAVCQFYIPKIYSQEKYLTGFFRTVKKNNNLKRFWINPGGLSLIYGAEQSRRIGTVPQNRRKTMKRLLVLLVAVFAASLLTASSYAADAKFNGHYRVMGFMVENMSQNGSLQRPGADEKWSYVEHRLRLNIDIYEGPVMGRLQINSAAPFSQGYKWGEGQDSSGWNREMFLQFPLGGAVVKVGKYWATSPYTLGEFIHMGTWEGLTITYPVSPALTLIASVFDTSDASEDDAKLYALVIPYSPAGSVFSGVLGWYYYVDNNSTTAGTYREDRPMWLVGTVAAAQGPWNVRLTGAAMFGDTDINIAGVSSSYDYNAHAYDVRASYNFAKAGGPPLTLEAIYGYGSGDDNQTASDRDYKEFRTPTPSYTHTSIFLDGGDSGDGGAQLAHPARSQAGGIGNLSWIGLKASYKLTAKSTLNASASTFYLAEKTANNPSYDYQDDELGQEYNLAFVHQLAKGLSLTLSGAWFIPNEKGWTTTTAAATAPDDTVSEYMTKLFWSF